MYSHAGSLALTPRVREKSVSVSPKVDSSSRLNDEGVMVSVPDEMLDMGIDW